MVNWWYLVAGLAGVVGIAIQAPTEIGSWLVGLAFLILLVSSFFEKK